MDEDLREQLEKFFEADEAGKIADDLRHTEQLFKQNPAPAPNEHLLTEIKNNISHHLSRTKTRRISLPYRIAAAAAALILFAVISAELFENTGHKLHKPPVNTAAISFPWDEDDAISTEVKQIEDETAAMLWAENGNGHDIEAIEIEIELMDINKNNFWKG